MTTIEIQNGKPVIRVPDKHRSNFDNPQAWNLIETGDKASYRRTVTEADIAMFAGATGDTNPYHFDELYASKGRFGKRIAHGMLASGYISTVLGTMLPGAGTILLKQVFNFKKPIFIGDTITAVAEVMNIREDKPIVTLRTDCVNQKGETVLEGEAVVLVEFVNVEQ